jgi:hypothetical protein
MDRIFELDSVLYICFEIEDGIKLLFVARCYHCGLTNH